MRDENSLADQLEETSDILVPTASESDMVVQVVTELLAQDPQLASVLDFGACKGDIGQSLAKHGLTEIYG